MRRVIVVCVIALAVPVRPARADLASSFYDDVRDVVEELIKTEVTQSVVAAVERRSPALSFYLHGTLERLASPYWGSLAHVLKDDLTVVIADFVYWHLSSGRGVGDVVASARSFFACVAQTGASKNDPACARLVEAVRGQHRPLLEVECRRNKPPAERRVACDIGLATLAALERRGEVRHHLIDALADIVLAEVADRGLADRLRDTLEKWLDLPKDLPTPLLEALANPDLREQLADGAIDKLCGDAKTLDDMFRDPTSTRAWICFAVTHPALPDQLAAHVTIVDAGHPNDKIDARIDFWVIEADLKDYDADRASDDSAFRLLADDAFDTRCPAGDAAKQAAWPCKGTRLPKGSTITVAWQGREMSGTVTANGQIEGKPVRQMHMTLMRFRKAIRRVEELRALVPPALSAYIFYPGSTPAPARKVLRSFARMARLVVELRGRWYLWAKDGGKFDDLDVAELLRAARDALGAFDSGDGTTNPLAFLDGKASGGASTIDVGDWMRMVMRGDYRSLAMESLRSALGVHLSEPGHPREKFFLTLAAYLLDQNEGVGEQVARSAFRAAAKELLLSQSHVGVPRADDRLRVRWLPRLALKLSFNDTYAVTDGSSKRAVVSADWPTLMVAVTDYAGLEASIIDPLAPLAEMALRPPGLYHRYEYVAVDALRPRLGAWVAVPQLSRRLALTVGFGARFLDVVRDQTQTAIDATYGFKVSLTFDAGVQFVF